MCKTSKFKIAFYNWLFKNLCDKLITYNTVNLYLYGIIVSSDEIHRLVIKLNKQRDNKMLEYDCNYSKLLLAEQRMMFKRLLNVYNT